MFCSSIYKRVLLLTTELSPFIFGLEVLSKLFNKFSVRKQRAGEAAAGTESAAQSDLSAIFDGLFRLIPGGRFYATFLYDSLSEKVFYIRFIFIVYLFFPVSNITYRFAAKK